MLPPNAFRLVVLITLSSSLLGALFACAENRPHGIADFINTELRGVLAGAFWTSSTDSSPTCRWPSPRPEEKSTNMSVTRSSPPGLAAGLNEAACVRACFAALDRLAARGPAYERDFGCRADFRAGLHCGSVVIGELGYLKKEIALIGDSMNTAARIQEARRDTGCRVLASAALIERIGVLPVGVTVRSLGPLPMRGKEQPIALYALETVDGAE